MRRESHISNPVVHWEILGQDAKGLQDFYAQLFDWQVSADNPWNYGLVDTRAGAGITGGIGGTVEGTTDQACVRIFVQVDDLQGYLTRAESLGGKTIMPPTEIPGAVTMALFADPGGNVTGLVKG